MPLVVVTGLPSSGKTTAVRTLASWLEENGRKVDIVQEEALLGGLNKDEVFRESKEEKSVRGRLKSEVIRLLSRDGVVICDGLNYIKGFSSQDCHTWNNSREEPQRWNQEVMEALSARYE